MPRTSTVTCVGSASTSLPWRKAIIGRNEVHDFVRGVTASNSLGGGQAVASAFLRVGQRQGQGVRGVGRRRSRQVQQALDHLGHGEFLRGAIADDRLLHFARRDLVNLQAGLSDDRNRRAARLAQDEGG